MELTPKRHRLCNASAKANVNADQDPRYPLTKISPSCMWRISGDPVMLYWDIPRLEHNHQNNIILLLHWGKECMRVVQLQSANLCFVMDLLGWRVREFFVPIHDILLHGLMEHIHLSRRELPCADTSLEEHVKLRKCAPAWLW
jgi:hypothetical protein